LFYLTVVLKKGDVVDGGFQTQDVAESIVHLQGDPTHEVFGPRAFDTRLKLAAHFAVIPAREGIELFVQCLHTPCIRQLLRAGPLH
jgi:hypothetical protein